jgi:hypothetical protein
MNKMKRSGKFKNKSQKTKKGEKTMGKIAFPTITILFVCLMFTFSFNLNAAMFGNESESAYIPPPPPPNGAASISSITLRRLIADGGSHFFKSAGQINQFFSLVESSEVTGPYYKGLQKTLNGAIFYLEQSSATYLQLKSQAAVTPYNQEVISKLLNFDYDLFRQANDIFPDFFDKVKGFLAVGNVTGIYNEFYLYTVHILDLMYTLKKDIDAEIFPDISTVWIINQKYSEFKLFGQYVAQVFYSIK